MSKILIEGSKVIIDGHARDLETCNTLTNLCDELSKSDKFRTIKYGSGYGEFESVSDNEEKKFVPEAGTVTLYIKSNDGSSTLYSSKYSDNPITITTTGVSWYNNGSDHKYIYTGSKVFLGLSNTPNATVAKYTYGKIMSVDEYDTRNNFSLYIVEKDLGYQVNIQSNDGTTTLAQNATVDSVVVTSAGAQLKCGDTVNATYTYSGSKLFAGLATSANATVPKYKPGDTIEITAETALYIVENIIIPDHHSSLTELFTNIAAVIRNKTGSAEPIIADAFPTAIDAIPSGGGGVETCTVTFSTNENVSVEYFYEKIFLTVFENNEITTKTVSELNNITVPNVVLNSVGFVVYTSIPKSMSTTNATKLYTNSSYQYGFIFTGNASIYATSSTGHGGGSGN